MYFILRTSLNEKQSPIGFDTEIVGYTNKSITIALKLLEDSAKAYVKDECGTQAARDAKIIDIHNFNQVNEPVIDGIIIYRLEDDAHKLHIYRRTSTVVPGGWIYSQSIASKFERVQIFSLVENKEINIGNSSNVAVYSPVEMVTVGRIKIPKALTMAPMCNVIDQLKKNRRFQQCFENNDSTRQRTVSAPAIISEVKRAEIVDIPVPKPINIQMEVVEMHQAKIVDLPEPCETKEKNE